MFFYQLKDMQMAALAPVHLWAKASLLLLESPLFLPFQNDFTKYLTSSVALIEKHTHFHVQPSFCIKETKFRGTSLAVEEETLDLHPFCRLIHFKRHSDNEAISKRIEEDPKILVIPPLSGHYATILRNTVETLLPTYDVFLTEWIDGKKIPLSQGSFNIEDQVLYLTDVVKKLGPDLHLLAVTQASFSTLAAVALLAAEESSVQPRSMTLMGGPIDARRGFAYLREMAKKHSLKWFEDQHIQLVPPYHQGACRPVYPGFMQLRDRMALSMERKATELVKYFHHLVRGDDETPESRQKLYDEFLAVMDVPAELYLQFVDMAYKKCSLATGKMVCHGREVCPATIQKTALLTIEAELDDLSPPGQTRAAHDLCTGLESWMKEAHLEIGAGHYAIFSGRRWRNNVAPVIHRFIRKHERAAHQTEE